MIGLFWFASRQNPWLWWDQAPYYLAINLLANLSGWFGGFIGIGQIRESIAAGVIEFQVNGNRSDISGLIDQVKQTINSVFTQQIGGKFLKQTRHPRW